MDQHEYNQCFDDLMALMDPENDGFLLVDFTDGEFDFLQDLSAQAALEGCLVLTDKQAAWLAMIHAKITSQIKMARVRSARRRPDEEIPY